VIAVAGIVCVAVDRLTYPPYPDLNCDFFWFEVDEHGLGTWTALLAWFALGFAALPVALIEELLKVAPGRKRIVLALSVGELVTAFVLLALVLQDAYTCKLVSSGSYAESLDQFNMVVAQLWDGGVNAFQDGMSAGVSLVELVVFLLALALPFAASSAFRLANDRVGVQVLAGAATGLLAFAATLVTTVQHYEWAPSEPALYPALRRLVVVGALGAALPLAASFLDRIGAEGREENPDAREPGAAPERPTRGE
jgi:hypothetical protein